VFAAPAAPIAEPAAPASPLPALIPTAIPPIDIPPIPAAEAGPVNAHITLAVSNIRNTLARPHIPMTSLIFLVTTPIISLGSAFQKMARKSFPDKRRTSTRKCIPKVVNVPVWRPLHRETFSAECPLVKNFNRECDCAFTHQDSYPCGADARYFFDRCQDVVMSRPA
jgi:hypothetical protein